MIDIAHQFELPLIDAWLCADEDLAQQGFIPTETETPASVESAVEPVQAVAPATDIAPLLESIDQSLAQLRRQQDLRVQKWQSEAIELGMTVARAIVAKSVATSNDRILDLIQSAQVDFFDSDQPVTIHVHPNDLNRIRELNDVDFAGQAALVADGTLPEGDCQISNGEVTIASDLNLQLEEVHRLLVEELRDE